MKSFCGTDQGAPALTQVHPCVIDGQATLVHHRALAKREQSLFQKLASLAKLKGWRLQADRRRAQKFVTRQNCRRKNVYKVLCLSALLQSAPAVSEDIKAVFHSAPQQASPSEAIRAKIEALLLTHWRRTPNDPPHTRASVQQMAAYFSQFGQVRQLLNELSSHSWSLEYKKDNFSSDIKGTLAGIDSVRIYFDPNSAGQFRFQVACQQKRAHCIAKPADLVLHELLHAHLAFNHSSQFFTDGGLHSTLYPYQHESRAIALEQRYYRAMTRIDNTPRPYRTEHLGRPVRVKCVTCIE